MPVYSKSPGKWLVRIYQSGRPQSWVVEGSKDEAKTFEARKRLELTASAGHDHRTAPPFSDFCLGPYKLHATTRLAEKTWRNRKYQVATLIEFFDDKKLDRITARDVERFQRWRADDGIGAVKINDDVKVLLRILSYARGQGIPAADPHVERLPERKTTGRVKVWTGAEVTRLYKAVAKEWPRGMPIVATLLNTGMRKGEALALRWGHIDTRRKLIKVHPSKDWRPKDNEPREVPLSAPIRPYFRGAAKKDPEAPVFPTLKGSAYSSWPQRYFDKARKAAGLEGGPHTCRHTYASHFLAGCPDMFLLAKVLGHSHERVTALYAHLLPDHLERARDVVVLSVPRSVRLRPV